jgi:isoleucyl-tRNA synthetase
VTVDVSAFYGDVTKDRLYLDPVDAPGRRAAQVVQYECARAIALLAAPILCFTADEIWRHLPKRAGDPDSVHLAVFPEVVAAGQAPAAEFERVLAWREIVNRALEPFRAAKNKSIDAAVVLHAPAADREPLARHAAELADTFLVSSVEIRDGDGTATVTAHPGPRCERCWKHYDRLAAEPNDVCERCAQALRERRS